YFELLHILEFKKAERVKDCAEVLEYKVSYETGEKTLYRVWFCKSRLCPICNWRRAMKHGIIEIYKTTHDITFFQSRLCPMCNWRRAMKHGIQSQKVVAEVIKQKPTVRWLFL